MIPITYFMNEFFDDSFAIRKMNEMKNPNEVTHDDDGATIKLKVPGFNKKSIDISVDSETLTIEGKTDDDSFVKRFSIFLTILSEVGLVKEENVSSILPSLFIKIL